MNINETSENLLSKKSKDRKRAAKEIGKNKYTELADLLYKAYKKEKNDKRTWETQVEMITALGILDYKKALADIELIVKHNLPHDSITSSASTSYVRLTRKSPNDASTIIALLKSGSFSVVSGALKTLALDKMKPPTNEMKEILSLSFNIQKHKDRIGKEYGLMDPRIYIALACHDWNTDLTEPFLNHCIKTACDVNRFDKPVENTNLIDVCKNSLKGKMSKGYL